jgi:hypothetical protein
MNADSAGTRSPHLDLEDLIAEAAGQPATDRATDHLAHCEQCRLEADRWNLVAAGIRHLTAAGPEQADPPSWPRRTRLHRLLAEPRKRAVTLLGAAAALALLAGGGYWATAALTATAPGTVLTAVSGCAGVELAHGTLAAVNGGSLIIKSAGRQPLTVTVNASVRVSVAGNLLSDITDGAQVRVLGPGSAGSVTATTLTIGPPPGGASGKGARTETPPPGWTTAQGTVADAGPAGFTVVTPGGARVAVTVTGATFVVVPDASLSQLRAGVTTVAVGHAGPRGTLTAVGILQEPPGPIQVHFNVATQGCPPATLDSALAAALAAGD